MRLVFADPAPPARGAGSALDLGEPELERKTVCVIGDGQIGREVEKLAVAVGALVVPVSRSLGNLAALADVLERSDFAVVAVAHAPETEGLVGARELEALGPDGYLVNVASRCGTSSLPGLELDAVVRRAVAHRLVTGVADERVARVPATIDDEPSSPLSDDEEDVPLEPRRLVGPGDDGDGKAWSDDLVRPLERAVVDRTHLPRRTNLFSSSCSRRTVWRRSFAMRRGAVGASKIQRAAASATSRACGVTLGRGALLPNRLRAAPSRR
jgi:hypothetical protein